MLSISGLNGYESTLDFVNELKNHLSIAKICENDELRKCWPTEKVVIDDEGKEWEIAKTKTGMHLKMKNDDTHEWSDTVGLITGDGTSMILSYNTKCDVDPTRATTWTSDKSSSTNCVAAVFDWNGSSKPNSFGVARADVLVFNANGLGQACNLEINGKCFGTPFQPTAVTKAECQAMADAGYGNKKEWCHYENDYWAGPLKQCGGVDKMPSMDDLLKLVPMMYTGTKLSELTYIPGSAASLGLPEPPFCIMADEYNEIDARIRCFSTDESYSLIFNGSRYLPVALALCVAEE